MKFPIDRNKFLRQISVFKNNPLAIIAAAAVIFILDAGFLLRWQFESVCRFSAQVKQLSTEIADLKSDTKFFATYKNKLTDLRNEVADLNKAVITEENLPAVIESISKFANMSGVRILEIKPITENAAEQKTVKMGTDVFFRKKISISVKTGFHQLGRFMALLENHTVFLNIKNIEIRADGQEFLRQTVTMTVEVVVVRKV
jgi:Tfp pilus assembly protein PilO